MPRRMPAAGRLAVACLALLVAACGDDGGGLTPDAGCFAGDAAAALCNGIGEARAGCVPAPDPSIIADPASPAQVTVAPFVQEVYRRFLEADGLPARAITALVVADDGTLWAGTSAGLASLDASQSPPVFVAAAGDPGATPIAALGRGDGDLVVAFDDAVGHLRAGAWEDVVAIAGGGARAVAQDGAVTWVGTASGLYRVESDAATAVSDLTAEVRALLVESPGTLLVAAGDGLHRGAPGAWTLVAGLPSEDVRALAAEPDGAVLAGTAAGLAVLRDGAVEATVRGGPGALPFEDITAVAAGADGTRLVGFARGAARPRDDAWHLYFSRRWTPADGMTAVAVAADRLYLGTAEGLGEVSTIPMALADKAAIYEQAAEARHIRMDGFVTTTVGLVDPDDLSQGAVFHDEDNDGLWTQMHIGALCLGYAATGDETLYQHARRSLKNMFLEMDVPAAGNPAIDGFVARSLVREDETDLWQAKLGEPDRWRGPVDYDGQRYLWKNDTSSDEVVGHYFGYALYYDLCAKDEGEREEVRAHVVRLTDYIVGACFKLLDEDGLETTFGKWYPEYVNEHLESQFGSRGLNAAEIISHLRVAYHMTGDPRYQEAYEYLIEVHGYGENIRIAHDYMKRAVINHSDDELLFLSYYPLLRYESDPARRAIWEEAVALSYDSDVWGERPERNPLWAFIYTYALGSGPTVDSALADAARTLREIPLDLRTYRVDNADRLDYAVNEQKDRFGDLQFTEVPPYDEKGAEKWNSNPYQVVQGGDERGSAELSGSHWLLAYYLGLYHGFIRE